MIVKNEIILPEKYEYVCKNYFDDIPQEIQPDTPYILALSVHPDYRNIGIGGQLLDSIWRMYEGSDITLLVLQNNIGAIHLYQKYGFLQKGELYKGYSSSEEVCCMEMIRSQ